MDRVSEETIKNCFRHAGFDRQPQGQETEECSNSPVTSDLHRVMDFLAEKASVDTLPEDFILIDKDLQTTAEMAVSEIIQSCQRAESESEEEDETEEPPRKITISQARSPLAQLSNFARQQEKGHSLFPHIGILEDKGEEISSNIM